MTTRQATLPAFRQTNLPAFQKRRRSGRFGKKKRGRGERVAEGNCITMTDVGGVPAQWHLLGDKNVGFPDFFFFAVQI